MYSKKRILCILCIQDCIKEFLLSIAINNSGRIFTDFQLLTSLSIRIALLYICEGMFSVVYKLQRSLYKN